MRSLRSLTLEAMIALVSETFAPLPAPRHPDRIDYRLHDTLMSGFAMMCFQYPNLLEFQRKMKQRPQQGNLETIFGVREVEAQEALAALDRGQWPEGPTCRRRFSTYRVARGGALTESGRVRGTFLEV
jgi:hypothetical protein